MHKYLFNISYLGTNYSGLQKQPDNTNSIQAIIESRLIKYLKTSSFTISLASRTDKGVHAKSQYFLLTLEKTFNEMKLQESLNNSLPLDIRVLNINKKSEHFNIHESIQSKTYRYYFTTKDLRAFESIWCSKIRYDIDIDLMKEAVKKLIGEHNFKNLCSPSGKVDYFKREIFFADIKEHPLNEDIYYLEISAPGFLKYMVRYIFSALIMVGNKTLNIEEFKNLLTPDSKPIKLTKASAHGLALEEIKFKL